MKGHVEIDHLTKYDAFRVNRDQVWTLKYGSKSMQTSLILRQRPHTIHMLTLKSFHQFCDNCKIPSCTYYLKEAEMKITMFAYFKEYNENHKKF